LINLLIYPIIVAEVTSTSKPMYLYLTFD